MENIGALQDTMFLRNTKSTTEK